MFGRLNDPLADDDLRILVWVSTSLRRPIQTGWQVLPIKCVGMGHLPTNYWLIDERILEWLAGVSPKYYHSILSSARSYFMDWKQLHNRSTSLITSPCPSCELLPGLSQIRAAGTTGIELPQAVATLRQSTEMAHPELQVTYSHVLLRGRASVAPRLAGSTERSFFGGL
jgi:hypothetical protein